MMSPIARNIQPVAGKITGSSTEMRVYQSTNALDPHFKTP